MNTYSAGGEPAREGVDTRKKELTGAGAVNPELGVPAVQRGNEEVVWWPVERHYRRWELDEEEWEWIREEEEFKYEFEKARKEQAELEAQAEASYQDYLKNADRYEKEYCEYLEEQDRHHAAWFIQSAWREYISRRRVCNK